MNFFSRLSFAEIIAVASARHFIKLKCSTACVWSLRLPSADDGRQAKRSHTDRLLLHTMTSLSRSTSRTSSNWTAARPAASSSAAAVAEAVTVQAAAASTRRRRMSTATSWTRSCSSLGGGGSSNTSRCSSVMTLWALLLSGCCLAQCWIGSTEAAISNRGKCF